MRTAADRGVSVPASAVPPAVAVRAVAEMPAGPTAVTTRAVVVMAAVPAEPEPRQAAVVRRPYMQTTAAIVVPVR